MSMVSNANLRNLSFLSLASACALAAPPDPGFDPCSLPDMNDMLLHEPACALGVASVRPNRWQPTSVEDDRWVGGGSTNIDVPKAIDGRHRDLYGSGNGGDGWDHLGSCHGDG